MRGDGTRRDRTERNGIGPRTKSDPIASNEMKSQRPRTNKKWPGARLKAQGARRKARPSEHRPPPTQAPGRRKQARPRPHRTDPSNAHQPSPPDQDGRSPSAPAPTNPRRTQTKTHRRKQASRAGAGARGRRPPSSETLAAPGWPPGGSGAPSEATTSSPQSPSTSTPPWTPSRRRSPSAPRGEPAPASSAWRGLGSSRRPLTDPSLPPRALPPEGRPAHR